MNNVRKECFANITKLSKTIKEVLKGLEQDKIQWQQNKRSKLTQFLVHLSI